MNDVDRNFFSVADTSGRVLEGMRFDPTDEGGDAMEWDDTLKFSHASACRVRRCWVRGGTENAIDMNRECRDIQIADTTLLSGAQCAVVIKGGSEDIELLNVAILHDQPTAYDIELGGWSDQSLARTRRVTLCSVIRSDVKPVRIVVGWADRPRLEGGQYRILFWRSIGLKLFWLGRFLAKKWRKQ